MYSGNRSTVSVASSERGASYNNSVKSCNLLTQKASMVQVQWNESSIRKKKTCGKKCKNSLQMRQLQIHWTITHRQLVGTRESRCPHTWDLWCCTFVMSAPTVCKFNRAPQLQGRCRCMREETNLPLNKIMTQVTSSGEKTSIFSESHDRVRRILDTCDLSPSLSISLTVRWHSFSVQLTFSCTNCKSWYTGITLSLVSEMSNSTIWPPCRTQSYVSNVITTCTWQERMKKRLLGALGNEKGKCSCYTDKQLRAYWKKK